MRIHKLTLWDWIVNWRLRNEFNHIRKYKPNLLVNKSNPIKKGYKLTFNDDFDKVSWSWKGKNAKWGIGEDWGAFHPGWTNKYFGEPILTDDSCAKFIVKYKPKIFKTEDKEILIPYVASWLSTANTFQQQYGRFECRMTLPKERGSWPAFWLWGPTWPPEIDIIEAYGKNGGKDIVFQEINVHWNNIFGNRKNMRPWPIQIDDYDEDLSNRFHEFALEWTPDGLYFYTDGIKVFQYTNKRVLNRNYNSEGVKPFVTINNNIMKEIDGSDPSYYSEFKVDYIRVYTKVENGTNIESPKFPL